MCFRRLWLHASRTVWCLLVFIAPLSTVAAETHAGCEQQFAPRSGEPGKDVMWVATIDEVVTAMLRVAGVTNRDRVIDLGSGDGKIPIAAAKQFGASALGIEYNPQLVQLAECHARVEQVTDKAQFQQGDIFQIDFSDATVLTLYLGPTINLKLRPTILNMRPGTRVVSNNFDMGEWRPDEVLESDVGNTRALLWIVPAQIAGEWRFTEVGGTTSFDVELRQSFQFIEALAARGERLGVREGRLEGNRVELVVLEHQPVRLIGEVSGERILVAEVKDSSVVRRYIGTRR
ncbi:class I SAM-dependent methyltransferase [Steroidobacter cummioxidans]|uniref:class I SAM-dependent methyltransferase n=1 Tax=Steroidobacter cummioxidans TaxID=1803913 RepID=UPI000E3238C2|nr:methyltransferase domain-containing protein [Steroidobacter cummioxidans]